MFSAGAVDSHTHPMMYMDHLFPLLIHNSFGKRVKQNSGDNYTIAAAHPMYSHPQIDFSHLILIRE